MSILDEPAFPQHVTIPSGHYYTGPPASSGMSGRVYAAIHLCVPESGDAELDAMIRKAQRVRLAGVAMQAMVEEYGDNLPESAENTGEHLTIGRMSRLYADAMLAELEKKP